MPTVQKSGFTFIELMIVMSIMALMTVLAFANIGSFRKEQELASATADIQSALRVAQNNSKSGLKCNNVPGIAWGIVFNKNENTIKLTCADQSTAVPLKSGIKIKDIQGVTDCSSPITVYFSPVYGLVSFKSGSDIGDSCISELTTTSLQVTLHNDSGDKVVSINKGGSINVQ